MKNGIKKLFPGLYEKIKKIYYFFVGFSRKSYSQFGEDLILSSFFSEENLKKGFYIDIGSYHPEQYSNTNIFYKKGWSGINIDARPGSMNVFNIKRRRDVNLEIGVSKNGGDLYFFIFEEGALNTFSEELANKYKSLGYKMIEKRIVKTSKLGDILDTYLPKSQKIDFMSIDVEGVDVDVLESNNWDLYKPRYLLIEMHGVRFADMENSKFYLFLNSIGYELVSIAYITLIFKNSDYKNI